MPGEFNIPAGRPREPLNGHYVGMVVQNNDPEGRGRVKIYVPHALSYLYKDWEEKNDLKKWKFPGKNVGPDVTNVLDELKIRCPWAEPAMPIAGASSSGRYNAHDEVGSISDSARPEQTEQKEEKDFDQHYKTKYSLNKDGIGEKPARHLETDELRLNDPFNDTIKNNTNRINKYSYNYTPNSYSNKAKGSFSVPNVGAHLWVFFTNGNPRKPVYFAATATCADWQGIYESHDEEAGPDYPGTYENKSKKDDPKYNYNTETYRNKYVLNQKGGTLEIVNSDNKELLKMTHYKGSFLEFNNDTTVQLAVGNDQKMVTEDQFLTVKGFKNEWVERDYDFLVRGDFYTKIGNFATLDDNGDTKFYIKKWAEVMADIADAKQLFDIKRVDVSDIKTGNMLLNRLSNKQKKSPAKKAGHAKCPLCSDPKRDWFWKFENQFHSYTQVNDSAYNLAGFTDGALGRGPLLQNWHSGGTGDVSIDDAGVTSGTYGYEGSTWSMFSSVDSTLVLATTALAPFDPTAPIDPTNFLGGGPCPCCGGDGLSPSTEGGVFDVEDKQTKVIQALKDKINELTNLEKKLGIGGSEVKNIHKHKIENIGVVVNEFPSVRIDPIGKISKNEVVIRPHGVVNNEKPSAVVELVHVDDLPGGSYSLNVCNRYNVQVGAGGVTMKSLGPVNISGTVTNIAGDQVNIGSEYEINLCTAGRLNIVADILTLRQKNYKQVLVDSNLGVTQNVIIGGNCHIEGGLHVQHVTAPTEYQQTEQIRLAVRTLQDVGISCNITGGTHTDAADSADNHNSWTGASITFTADQELGWSYPHSHQFKNLPLTLMDSNSGVRTMAAAQCGLSGMKGMTTETKHMKNP